MVIGDECARPKPDPEPYRAAMRALGVTPSRAVAFEDSRSGLRAARGAGALVFGLTTGLAPRGARRRRARTTSSPTSPTPPSGRISTELKARVA